MAEYTWANWLLWGGFALVVAAVIGAMISAMRAKRVRKDFKDREAHQNNREWRWPVDSAGVGGNDAPATGGDFSGDAHDKKPGSPILNQESIRKGSTDKRNTAA